MSAAPIEEATLQYGLLLETAQSQQKLVASSLQQLEDHARGLDSVVREQIRHTLLEELGAVIEHSAHAVQALRALERAARWRSLCWTLAAALLSIAGTLFCAWWLLPSDAEISALRLKREQLMSAVQGLEQQGGRIDLRRCGNDERWCVRVDRRAPAYGEQADYFILRGY